MVFTILEHLNVGKIGNEHYTVENKLIWAYWNSEEIGDKIVLEKRWNFFYRVFDLAMITFKY